MGQVVVHPAHLLLTSVVLAGSPTSVLLVPALSQRFQQVQLSLAVVAVVPVPVVVTLARMRQHTVAVVVGPVALALLPLGVAKVIMVDTVAFLLLALLRCGSITT